VDEGSGPRWLLPSDDGLILAIGRAVYGFAQFERSVECARQAVIGLLGGAVAGGHSVEKSALPTLERMARARSPDGESAAQLLRIFGLYRDLKARRDSLLKIGRPDPDEDARRTGVLGQAACAWCAEDILSLARQIEAAAVETNHLLRKGLYRLGPLQEQRDPA
jgi:hypothetical protein